MCDCWIQEQGEGTVMCDCWKTGHSHVGILVYYGLVGVMLALGHFYQMIFDCDWLLELVS